MRQVLELAAGTPDAFALRMPDADISIPKQLHHFRV